MGMFQLFRKAPTQDTAETQVPPEASGTNDTFALPTRSDPLLEKEKLSERLGRIIEDDTVIADLLHRYETIQLTLPITDHPMRRVCEVLTIYGMETLESCDGHGKKLPCIFVQTDERVRELTTIATNIAGPALHFRWSVETFCNDPQEEPEAPLKHVVTPRLPRQEIDISEHYNNLLLDIDIIGLMTLHYMEKNYQPTTHIPIGPNDEFAAIRIDALKNHRVEDIRGNSIPVRPHVEFVFDHEHIDLISLGTHVEKLFGGAFIVTEEPVNEWPDSETAKSIRLAPGYVQAILLSDGTAYYFPVKKMNAE